MLDDQSPELIIRKLPLDTYFSAYAAEVSIYPNPELKWERTNSINAGLEFSVLNGSVMVGTDIYYKKTKDAFQERNVSKVNGIVNDIPVAIGQTVTASQPIVTVAGNTDLVVEASIPEKFLGTIAEGMTAEMESVAYPGRIYTGILTYIAPTVDSTTRSSDIEIQLTGDTAGLKEGMYIRLNLETEHIDNALTVPSSALDAYLGDDIVYIADGDTARRTIVTTGSTNGVDTVITSGLSEGDMVITAGNVTDGTAISVVNQEN